jgi:hypothetical protein
VFHKKRQKPKHKYEKGWALRVSGQAVVATREAGVGEMKKGRKWWAPEARSQVEVRKEP